MSSFLIALSFISWAVAYHYQWSPTQYSGPWAPDHHHRAWSHTNHSTSRIAQAEHRSTIKSNPWTDNTHLRYPPSSHLKYPSAWYPSEPRRTGNHHTYSHGSKTSYHWGHRTSNYHNKNINNLDEELRGNLLIPNSKVSPDAVSLVFVLDSTGSMYEEIRQVRDGIKIIFKTIWEHPESTIHNFILVPFNDPLVGPIMTTTDPQTFISQLESIRLFGGGDCDEKSLKGLQLAINNSLPRSHVFVFTDAGAKDYHLLPRVETLIQQKQSQVVFILTGDCGGQDKPGYQAYEHIAAMSFGQVFNLWKDEVHKILKFVNYTIYEKNMVNIMSDDTGPGSKTYTVPVDSQTNTLTVSVSGKDPTIHMKDPNGHEVEGKSVLDVHTGLVINVKEPDQGNWSVNVGSTSNHHVRMSGSSEFSFAYGFSNSKADQFETASLQPVSGTLTSLLVKVTQQSQLHKLTTVYLKNQETVKKLDLYPVKGHPDLYKTIMFTTPNKQFFLEVLGVDRNGFTLKRISQTAINPINAGPPPVVNTLRNMELYPGSKHQIWCHVESKTNYSVRWSRRNKYGNYLPVIGSRFRIMTTGNLEINPVQAEDEGWYQCTAENEAGETKKQVHVEVRDQLQVKVSPRKAYFMLGENVTLSCTAEGQSRVMLEWKKNGKVIQPTDSRLEMAASILNLHLVNANESDEGKYECAAMSNADKALGTAEIVYVQYPTVSRTATDKVLSMENATVVLQCSIEGKPKPTISWLKNGRKIKPDQNYEMLSTGDLSLTNVQVSSAGAFTCIGKNSLGQTQQTINLEVGVPPKLITSPQDTDIPFNSSGSIPCDIQGSPKPEISWQRVDGKKIDQARITTGKSCTLIISDAKYEDRGTYSVIAQNSFGIMEIPVTVTISGVEPPKLGNTYQVTQISAGDTVILPCHASGSPPPDFQWFKNGSPVPDIAENVLILKNVQQDTAGTYKCHASNMAGNVEKVFYVTVVGNTKVKN